jgi:hypothetical protein
MEKAEDITVRVSIPRLRPDVAHDSEQPLLTKAPPVVEKQPKRRDEDDTRRIRKV